MLVGRKDGDVSGTYLSLTPQKNMTATDRDDTIEIKFFQQIS